MYRLTYQSESDLTPQVLTFQDFDEACNAFTDVHIANPEMKWKVMPNIQPPRPMTNEEKWVQH